MKLAVIPPMRKSVFWQISLLLLSLPLTGRAAGLMPVKDFTRKPEVSDLQISPDGKTLAFIGNLNDVATLYFRDLATKKISKVDPDGMNGDAAGKKEIVSFLWVADGRVVFSTASWDRYIMGMSAVDRDGTHWMGLTGYNRGQDFAEISGGIKHVCEDLSGRIYLNSYVRDGAHADRPSVLAIDTRSGSYWPVARNPDGDVTRWIVDHQDRVRIGMVADGLYRRANYRADDNSPWEPLPDMSSRRGCFPIDFDYDGRTLYVGKLTPHGTWGLYRYDLVTRKLGALLLEDPTYDIINPHTGGGYLIFNHAEHRLLGVRYTTDWSRTVWFDPEMAAVQAALNRALPGDINSITSESNDWRKLIVLSWNGHNPGTYYLFDRAKGVLERIAVAEPWLNPAKLAESYSITCSARDGLLIHGYLTLPRGQGQKNLPLVVYPHGGPFVRDAPGYDPMVQFLASRGYAVLQVNYRGSPGYGAAFYRAGWKEVGHAIQNDITDGVKAMIAGGLADPKRIAIFGASYGGYSALWALENTPQLYRCGISLAGVTDWNSLIGDAHKTVRLGEHVAGADEAYAFWKKTIGNPATDEASLKAISPLYHVDQIKAPVFIIQGTEDHTVPEDQATRFIAALKEHGTPYESWIVKGETHSFFRGEDHAELFKRIESFLGQNMQ